ncbi:hypothetical protein [Dyella humicola]|uniref:hypothetical protein n=1 Tax=Dyella humicola TaxID=2992126 RepID=UPI00225ACC06|nr:hypothetical protein [Dyella humicola]
MERKALCLSLLVGAPLIASFCAVASPPHAATPDTQSSQKPTVGAPSALKQKLLDALANGYDCHVRISGKAPLTSVIAGNPYVVEYNAKTNKWYYAGPIPNRDHDYNDIWGRPFNQGGIFSPADGLVAILNQTFYLDDLGWLWDIGDGSGALLAVNGRLYCDDGPPFPPTPPSKPSDDQIKKALEDSKKHGPALQDFKKNYEQVLKQPRVYTMPVPPEA